MNKKDLYIKLIDIVGAGNVKINESMSNHTTLRVGGNVKYLVEPSDQNQLESLLKLLREHNQKFYVIGRGSNVLFRDGELDIVIIKISNKFSDIFVSENMIEVFSGVALAEVSKVAYKNSLTGLEFASGIPGTIGGAIAMNAGAYGGEIKDIVKLVKIIDSKGCVKILSNEDMEFSYRKSLLTDNPEIVVVSAILELKQGNKETIYDEMYVRSQKRVISQPLEKCNCGSTFKRPNGHFAGQLIEECGLKGFELNGVEVSSKHAGFIVNNGKTTATEMLNMIELVKDRVKDKFSIELEEEVRVI